MKKPVLGFTASRGAMRRHSTVVQTQRFGLLPEGLGVSEAQSNCVGSRGAGQFFGEYGTLQQKAKRLGSFG